MCMCIRLSMCLSCSQSNGKGWIGNTGCAGQVECSANLGSLMLASKLLKWTLCFQEGVVGCTAVLQGATAGHNTCGVPGAAGVAGCQHASCAACGAAELGMAAGAARFQII